MWTVDSAVAALPTPVGTRTLPSQRLSSFIFHASLATSYGRTAAPYQRCALSRFCSVAYIPVFDFVCSIANPGVVDRDSCKIKRKEAQKANDK